MIESERGTAERAPWLDECKKRRFFPKTTHWEQSRERVCKGRETRSTPKSGGKSKTPKINE